MSTNLNTHTRKKWRERGYLIELTESMARLPGGITRKSDLFGFCDLLLIPQGGTSDTGWVYCQVTSRGHISTRLRKIQNELTGTGQYATPMAWIARQILERGDRILIEGWDQPKGPGTRWRSKERWLTLSDLEGES